MTNAFRGMAGTGRSTLCNCTKTPPDSLDNLYTWMQQHRQHQCQKAPALPPGPHTVAVPREEFAGPCTQQQERRPRWTHGPSSSAWGQGVGGKWEWMYTMVGNVNFNNIWRLQGPKIEHDRKQSAQAWEIQGCYFL